MPSTLGCTYGGGPNLERPVPYLDQGKRLPTSHRYLENEAQRDCHIEVPDGERVDDRR